MNSENTEKHKYLDVEVEPDAFEPCVVIEHGAAVTKKYRWELLELTVNKLISMLTDEQVEKIAENFSDPSTHKKWNITRALMPVQLDDQPGTLVIPQNVWNCLSPENQEDITKSICSWAGNVQSQKEQAGECLKFLDNVKENMPQNVAMQHHREGASFDHYSVIYTYKVTNEKEAQKAIKNIESFKQALKETYYDAGITPSLAYNKTKAKNGIVFTVTLSQMNLMNVMEDEVSRGKLHDVLINPEPVEVSHKPSLKDKISPQQQIKRMVEKQREKIDAGEEPKPRTNWSGNGNPVPGRKEILRAGRGADNRPDSTSYEMGA